MEYYVLKNYNPQRFAEKIQREGNDAEGILSVEKRENFEEILCFNKRYELNNFGINVEAHSVKCNGKG